MDNTYTIKIEFLWDDGVDHKFFQFIAANDEDAQRIVNRIRKAHDFLDKDDTQDRYGICGRNPDTLIEYVGETSGLVCEELVPDFTVALS